jgi:hypothetical protein
MGGQLNQIAVGRGESQAPHGTGGRNKGKMGHPSVRRHLLFVAFLFFVAAVALIGASVEKLWKGVVRQLDVSAVIDSLGLLAVVRIGSRR